MSWAFVLCVGCKRSEAREAGGVSRAPSSSLEGAEAQGTRGGLSAAKAKAGRSWARGAGGDGPRRSRCRNWGGPQGGGWGFSSQGGRPVRRPCKGFTQGGGPRKGTPAPAFTCFLLRLAERQEPNAEARSFSKPQYIFFGSFFDFSQIIQEEH